MGKGPAGKPQDNSEDFLNAEKQYSNWFNIAVGAQPIELIPREAFIEALGAADEYECAPVIGPIEGVEQDTPITILRQRIIRRVPDSIRPGN